MSGSSIVLRPDRDVSMVVSRRFLVVLPCLLLALVASALAALNMGSMQTGLADVYAALFLPLDAVDEETRAVALFRLPRIGVALLAGAMMAASGYLLQVVSRNGLADPGLLGLSDGAALAVLSIVVFIGPTPSGTLSFAALGGAFATACLVLAVARRFPSGGAIILVGLAFNVVLGALVEIVMLSGSTSMYSQLLVWSRGTLATVSLGDFTVLAIWFAILFPAVLLLGRLIPPLLLGDETATTLGVPVKLLTVVFVLLATAFSAPVVASCGPIAFVGLLAAHVARGLVGAHPTERLVVAMLSGALIVLWADTLGRTLFLPMVVPAGIAVTVIGALALIFSAWLLRRGRAAG